MTDCVVEELGDGRCFIFGFSSGFSTFRLSIRTSESRNSWIRWIEPTEPMKFVKAMISDPSGSERSVNSERDVKTRFVSSVLPLPLLRARTENTVKVRIGATTGVLKPESDQVS